MPLDCCLQSDMPGCLQVVQRNFYGKAVDWWAVGILFYELLVGRTPFEGLHGHIFDHIVKGEVRTRLRKRCRERDVDAERDVARVVDADKVAQVELPRDTQRAHVIILLR